MLMLNWFSSACIVWAMHSSSLFCILQSLRIYHMAWHRCSICTSHPTAQQLENYLGRLLRGMCCLENWTALSAQIKTETSKDFFWKVAKLFATNICFLKKISRSKNPIAIRCPLSGMKQIPTTWNPRIEKKTFGESWNGTHILLTALTTRP